MKKLKTLFLLAVLPLTASAYDAKLNGIYYVFDKSAYTAKVTSNGTNSYFGVVVIPSTVTYGGITYPVTTIDDAFYACSSLSSVTIPSSVTSIANFAFYHCSSLTSIVVESGNTVYDSRDNCNAIIETATGTLVAACKNSFIPNGVKIIKSNVFEEISSLTSVNIPNSVTTIESGAFRGCTNLESVTMGNSVTTIGSYAFSDCTGLKSIKIPNSVTEIGNRAFSGCSGLAEVTIGNGVTTIGSEAFEECSSLTEIRIPNKVTTINSSTFTRCSSLKTIIIPNSVTSIGYDAFSYCTSLLDVYCYAEQVPNTNRLAFSGSNNENVTLHVPEASLASYKSIAGSMFGNIVALDIPYEKCATPTITYVDGKVVFDCETEGVSYVANVTCLTSGEGDHDVSSISLTATYMVTVYATRDGYLDSNVAAKEINVSGAGAGGIRGDVNEDGEVNVGDIVVISNIMSGNE